MLRIVAAMAMTALLMVLPLGQAAAQNNTLGGALLGGAAGAAVGGIATGKAGGAIAGGVIGAAAGAIIGSEFDRRKGSYYWYKGRCYHRVGDRYYYASRKHCF